MRNGQGGRRRGRGGGGRPQTPMGARGPEMGNRLEQRARGNAHQLLEKYKSLARDATLQGERITAEYYMQYADHYYRVLNENRQRDEERGRGRDRQDGERGYNDRDYERNDRDYERNDRDYERNDRDYERESPEETRAPEPEPVGFVNGVVIYSDPVASEASLRPRAKRPARARGSTPTVDAAQAETSASEPADTSPEEEAPRRRRRARARTRPEGEGGGGSELAFEDA